MLFKPSLDDTMALCKNDKWIHFIIPFYTMMTIIFVVALVIVKKESMATSSTILSKAKLLKEAYGFYGFGSFTFYCLSFDNALYFWT